MPAASRRDWLTVVVTAASPLGPAMVVATLGLGLPDIRASLGLTEVQGGSLFSVIFLVAAGASAVAGRLADRIGQKGVLVCGALALALGFGGSAAAGSYAHLLSLLAVTGLGYGFITAPVFSLMSSLLPGARGLAAGLVSSAYGIGGLIGPLAASTIIARVDWRLSILCVGGAAFAVAMLQLWGIRAPDRAGPATLSRTGRPPRGGFRLDRNMLLLALAELFGGSVFWTTSSWTPTVLRSVKDLTLHETGIVMATWGATPIFAAVGLGMLSDRFGRKSVILATAYPGAAVATLIYAGLTTPASLAVGLLFLGICKATVPSLVVAMAQDASAPGQLGAATGLVMSMHYVAAFTAPLIAAQLIAGMGDMVWAMILASALPFVVFGTLIAAVKKGDVRS